MSSVNEILDQVQQLEPAERARLVRELARAALAGKLARVAGRPDMPGALSDEEIDRIVHDARRETLRASGL